MINLIIAELMKLKRSYILWISFIVATFIPIFNTILNWKKATSDFRMLSVNALTIGMFLVYPCLYGIIIAFLFNMEYTSNMMKTLLTIPISKKSLFSSKIIVLFMWSVLLLLWNAIVTIIGSLIIHTPGVTLQNILFVFSINLRTAPVYIICVLPLVAIIVASRKNYTLSIGISIAITLSNIVVQGTGNTKLASLWPWLIVWRFNGADKSGLNIPFAYPTWISGITLIGFGIISLIITFRSLRKQNN